MTYHGCQFRAKTLINGKQVNEIWIWDEYAIKLEETHVWLNCSPLLDPNKNMAEGPTRSQQGNMCQVIFYYQGAGPITRCGVHLLGHQVGDVSETQIMVVDDDIHCRYQDELVSLSLGSTGGVWKRPRGSDTIAVDNHGPNVVVMDHDHEEQYLTLFSEPADHPKRRHIDFDEEQNSPIDVNGARSIKGIDDVAEEMHLMKDYFGQSNNRLWLDPFKHKRR
ncbi:uncharacterized protein LOC110745154 [Prunus avium]|uniref:Uncharacterized protein LOC110745154 n=1 Tax=Prunus avium TaxID=42229 RepID=A0A6P5RGD3_PRUAV|nr:uncharacterized protein LOC110745154 [Prunus avium]